LEEATLSGNWGGGEHKKSEQSPTSVLIVKGRNTKYKPPRNKSSGSLSWSTAARKKFNEEKPVQARYDEAKWGELLLVRSRIQIQFGLHPPGAPAAQTFVKMARHTSGWLAPRVEIRGDEGQDTEESSKTSDPPLEKSAWPTRGKRSIRAKSVQSRDHFLRRRPTTKNQLTSLRGTVMFTKAQSAVLDLLSKRTVALKNKKDLGKPWKKRGGSHRSDRQPTKTEKGGGVAREG